MQTSFIFLVWVSLVSFGLFRWHQFTTKSSQGKNIHILYKMPLSKSCLYKAIVLNLHFVTIPQLDQLIMDSGNKKLPF